MSITAAVSVVLQHYPAPDAYQELVNADSDPEEPCIGRKCNANEHCCPGNVCVYVEGCKSKVSFPNKTKA